MRISIYFLCSALISLNANGQLNAEFSASPLILCVGAPVTFTDLSSNSVITWSWNFGDGNTSNLENPTHIYSAAGTYNITLTVFDGATSVAEVKLNYITVNPLPAVSFSTPLTGCEVPYSPVFTSVQPASGSYGYSWNFGNGQTSTSQIPSEANYIATGSYNISLTVTNNMTGCVNSTNQTINVFNFSTAFSASSNTVCVDEPVTFTDESTDANNWNWTFGNGTAGSSQNPVISYAAAGTYIVTLTSQNTGNGCSDAFTEIITVLPLPHPGFMADPLFGCNPLVVDFTNTSAGTGTFQWTFGNGSTFSGANPPDQTYATIGVFDVTLIMTDANGCSNTFTANDYITTSALIANFKADTTEGCEDLAVQFTDLSSSPNPADNPITEWSWDFGNGNTFAGQFPPQQLYSEGVYTVSLTVTTDGGCTQTLTKIDSIKVGVPPVVSFTYSPLTDCAKSNFDFTSTTVIPPGYDPANVTWEWDFGDGGTGNVENPTYNYPIDTGFFDVTLTVSLNGCPDSSKVTNAVYIKAPIALFSPEQMVFCNPTLPLSVEFADNAILGKTTDNVQMIWNWSEGGSDIFVSPAIFSNPDHGTITHVYTDYGTYSVEQIVHNFTTGCSDSITQVISVSFIDAGFTVSTDSVCRNSSVTLSDNSTSSDPIMNYIYDLDNDSTLSGPDLVYSYTVSGSYDIMLMAINNVGCADTLTINNFVVLQEPLAQILPSDTAGCAPLNVVFTNSSAVQGNGVPLAVFEWTFENGSTQITTDISQTTNYTFTTTGNFVTSLLVTDEFGCVSIPDLIATTITSPTAAFFVDSVACNFETFSAINNSANYTSSQWFIDGVNVSDQSNLSHVFNEANPTNLTSMLRDIKLVVTDENGCADSTETTLTISFPQPDATYVFTGSNVNEQGEFICPPVFAVLTDNSSSYGDITQWQWDFGDDNNSTLQNPGNTYVFAGTYTATLIVTDEFGCSDSVAFIDYLTIGGPSGKVDWIQIGDFCSPEFQFIATDLVDVASIEWNLGDLTTMNTTEPFIHTYINPGTYLPTALLQDDFNCIVYYEMNLITTQANIIHADFSVDPETLPIYEPMLISDNSFGGSGGIETWNWQMGVNNFTHLTGDDFTYEWQFAGYQDITLTVTDSLGCSDTAMAKVLITAELFIPNVFTANGDGINDQFVLREPVFETYNVVILNRWGKVVSESENQTGVYLWDGRDKGGNMCTDGVYFHKITGVLYNGDPVDTHGAVTLVVSETE